jgi:hypothetical protein
MVNLTDPDSRSIPVGFGFVQGYNAQAAVNEQQIVLAAEITNNSTDFSQLDPMVSATLEELQRAGIDQPPAAVAADAGYWRQTTAARPIANANRPSSRCSATPNTTTASTASTGEAESRCAPNGGY